MSRKCTWLAVCAIILVATPLFAQDKRVEISFLVGWTFSDGVDSGTGFPLITPEGTFDRADPKDSFKWGLTGGLLVTENAEVGFQFGQQASALEVSGPGTPTREVGDMTVRTYHGYFAYNFLEAGSQIRPYALFGMGATSFGAVDYTRLNGLTGTINGSTFFSTTWAAGVKFFFTPSMGARAGVQWTPTYIKSEPSGTWCDPFYGCYVAGDAQYASQWDINGGFTFRF